MNGFYAEMFFIIDKIMILIIHINLNYKNRNFIKVNDT